MQELACANNLNRKVILIKGFKKICSAALSLAMIFSLCVSACAVECNNEGASSVNRGGKVVRVDLPNGDGTFTTLEGDAAQEWYDNAVQEGNERAAREANLVPVEEGIEPHGAFHYQYRYVESKHTYDVKRADLERNVTNKLINNSSVAQKYTFSFDVSQGWTCSPSVSFEYKKAIKTELGGSWGKTYSKSESLEVTIPAGKTSWVSFVPIMDKSEGQAQKYYIPRGGLTKDPIVEESYDVVTYNPQYLRCKVGAFTFETVYGYYIWHEE